MNFIKNFKNIFSGRKEEVPVREDAVIATDDKSNTTSTEVEDEKPFSQPEPPAMRQVIRVAALSDDLFPPDDPDKILIKAQPTTVGDQCLFMLNRVLFPGYSWWFPDFESAEGSPLGERLFSLEDVEAVLVHEATVTVTRKDKTVFDAGCGMGRNSYYALKYGAKSVVGIDNDKKSVNAARKNLNNFENAEIKKVSIYEYYRTN